MTFRRLAAIALIFFGVETKEPDGFTGLTITVGAILTLFVLMQMTARVSWDDMFTPVLPGGMKERSHASRL